MKNRFGMFIHWGIYALYADHEQVLARRNLDNAAYERRMAEFNPVKYDPEEWVKLAKDAGMRYICFTAKHHDGFCMWNTRVQHHEHALWEGRAEASERRLPEARHGAVPLLFQSGLA